MHPWYRGFVGEIEPKAGKDKGSYTVSGSFRRVDDVTVEVRVCWVAGRCTGPL